MAEENRDPVSVESLLRLKRSERPNPEFWHSFEDAVREQTLQSLAREEWTFMRRLRRGLRAFRWVTAVGATAATATALLTLVALSPSFRSSTTPEALTTPVATPVAAAEAPPSEIVAAEGDFAVPVIPASLASQESFAREMETEQLQAADGHRRSFALDTLSASRHSGGTVAVLSF